jgi:hypothetical protein
MIELMRKRRDGLEGRKGRVLIDFWDAAEGVLKASDGG